MSPTLMLIVNYLSRIAKQNMTGPVECYWCSNSTHFIKYGWYWRYAVASRQRIAVQRYLCRRPQCQRTFSILPHPMLRISRWSLCMLCSILQMAQDKIPLAKIARDLDVSWPTVKRVLAMANRVLSWVELEARAEPVWAPSPCLHPADLWSDFIAMFAMKFYPARYAPDPTTEFVYR